MNPETADIAIIGAGASGLMSAISAAKACKPGAKIILLDSRQKIGAKILISGGTRCNVTNVRVTPEDYEGGAKHFVKHALEAFTPDETRKFFEEIGVELALEPTGKYFPVTHSGKTVLEALLKEIEKRKITLKTDVRIAEIKKMDNLFHLRGYPAGRSELSFECVAKRVILATGGLSYPETGSDGTGLEIAKKLGHSIVTTTPALTPLTTGDKNWQSLTGVTLNTRLSFFKNGKKKAEREGSFLFTHFGFSGPAALDISRFVARCADPSDFQVSASFVPAETEETFRIKFNKALKINPGKQIKNFLSDEFGLPSSFAQVFLKKIGLDETLNLKKSSKKITSQLGHQLLNYPLEVNGVIGYKKAEVTAGGVDLKEIQVSTMASRIVDGLFFSGEILDIDGRIGGFNFQWAWSTGSIAGRGAAKSLDHS